MAAQPGADALHTDHYVGDEKKRRRKGKRTMHELEDAVFKRDISTEKRKQLAKEGKALSDGTYPIETVGDLKNATILARSGHGDVAGAKALIGRRAKALGVANPLAGDAQKAEGDEWSADVAIWKGEREGKVYGVVLAPDRVDVQKDVLAPEDIEKACHEFMVLSRAADVQHAGEVVKADLIENYIAPCDYAVTMPDGTVETVTKGSWVQAWQVHDPVLKQEIESGKRTGFSIAGTGVRTPVTA